MVVNMLWFDVGNERYTTQAGNMTLTAPLWFDVGNERYTTRSGCCMSRIVPS